MCFSVEDWEILLASGHKNLEVMTRVREKTCYIELILSECENRENAVFTQTLNKPKLVNSSFS